ncbi:MAG: hypothetical protein Q8L10_01130 [Candidatus Moranbacteria bacterium]|nr:hypothetical protein [Candidatus Moranbacteria bacterium]
MERFLIVDIGVGADVKKEMAEKFELTILDAQAMINDLLSWQGWGRLDPWSTIIVLPGNGASIVKKYIKKTKPSWLNRWPWKFSPHAKRVWIPGENPQTFVNRIASTQMLLGVKNIVVMDDVISSGATIRHLRQVNEPWIPGADWQAIAWVKQESAAVKGFSRICATKTVGTKDRKVPINSLSTLVECREIAESYARRNLGNKAEVFLKIIEGLR